MGTVLGTGLDRFGQVWTSQNRCKVLFSSTVSRTLSKFGLPPKPACSFLTVLQSGGNSLSSRFNWRKVWTGVKCNFSSAQLHNRYVDGKLPISRVRMWNFTRIGRKIKKLRLSIIPALRQSHRPSLDQPQKGVVWTATFLGRAWTSHTSLESSQSWKLKYAVSADGPKDKKVQLFKFFTRKLGKNLR